MATLLHLDTSLNGDNSHSRDVTAAFRKAWNRGTRTNATQLRIEELGTLLAAPHKDPSAPR